MATPGLSRRTFLGGAAALGLATVGAGALTACQGSGQAGGPKVLRYQYQLTAIPSGLPKVESAVNDLLKARGKDFTITLQPMDTETFKTRMPLDLAAGNAGDIMFTAGWVNDYFKNASSDYYQELDELLPKHAPTLWAAYPAELWEATRVDGKLYGVINQQLWPATWGVQVQQKLLDQFGFDLTTARKMRDLEPLLAEIKGKTELTPVYTDNGSRGVLIDPLVYGYDPIPGAGLVIDWDSDALQVESFYETDAYRDLVTMMYEWRQKGYLAENPPSPTDAASAWNNGQIGVYFAQVFRNSVGDLKIGQASFIDPPVLTSRSLTSTLSAINADCDHVAEALQWFELINTDVELYNLLCFGVKDQHWVWEDEALKLVKLPAGQTAKTAPYVQTNDWMYGNQFNAYYRDRTEAETKRWDRDRKLNETAKRSKALGFTPSTESVATELANITATNAELGVPLALGLVDPQQALPKLNQQLKAAGLDRVRELVQGQVDQWKGSR